jgi:uncharacterized damage-inducible protein DinB
VVDPESYDPARRIWNWANGRTFDPAPTEIVLAPGQILTIETNWSGLANDGTVVARGRYRALGTIPSDARVPVRPGEFFVRPDPPPDLRLVLRLSVEPGAAPQGTARALLLSVSNPTNEPVTLTFPTTQLYDFQLSDPRMMRPTPLWTWSHGRGFERVETQVTIPANGRIEYVEGWDGNGNDGLVVGPGIYHMLGRLTLPLGVEGAGDEHRSPEVLRQKRAGRDHEIPPASGRRIGRPGGSVRRALRFAVRNDMPFCWTARLAGVILLAPEGKSPVSIDQVPVQRRQRWTGFQVLDRRGIGGERMTRTRKNTIRALCPALVKEHQLLMATLDAFMDDEMDFRPEARGSTPSLTVREIFMHVVDADHRFVDGGVSGKVFTRPEFVCDESFATITRITEGQLDRAAIRQELELSWKGVEAILDWPVAALQRKISPENRNSLLTLMTFAFMHHAQHRGQLWTYLELLGRRPPRAERSPRSRIGGPRRQFRIRNRGGCGGCIRILDRTFDSVGNIAQADGASSCENETVVLVAVVAAQARPGTDLFPLTVEYRERFSPSVVSRRYRKREGAAVRTRFRTAG